MSATTTAARPPRVLRKRRSSSLGPGGGWSSTAPPEVASEYAGDPKRGWIAWRRHLAARKLPPIARLIGGSGPPALWALPWDLDLEAASRRVRLAWRLAASGSRPTAAVRAVEEWLARSAPEPVVRASSNGGATADIAEAVVLAPSNHDRLPLALEALAWAAALPRLAALLPGELWWRLANRLIAIARQRPETIGEPLSRQILTAELPLTLAYLLGELEAARGLARTGRQALSEGLREVVDEKGLVHPPQLPILRPLVATWTRSQTLAAALELRLGPSERKRFRRCLEQALRLTRADGRPAFAPLAARRDDPWWIEAAVRLADDRGATKVLARLVEKGLSRARTGRQKRRVWPSLENEGASLAVLRSNWLSNAPRMAVVYDEVVRTELSVARPACGPARGRSKSAWTGTCCRRCGNGSRCAGNRTMTSITSNSCSSWPTK